MGHVTDKSDGGTNEDDEHNIQTGKQTKKRQTYMPFSLSLRWSLTLTVVQMVAATVFH